MAPYNKGTYNPKFVLNSRQAKENVRLPEKIRCDTCKKPKDPERGYSNKKLLDFKNGLATGRITVETSGLPKWITCRDCVGGPRHEMTCCMCEETKGLDGFSKAQRRTPDEARCETCMYMQVEKRKVRDNSAWYHAVEDGSDDNSSKPSDDEEDKEAKETEHDDFGSGVPLDGTESSAMPLSEHHLRQLSLQNESATTETLGNDWETQASKSKASTKTTAPKKAPFAAYSIGTKESTFNDDDYEADDGESAYTSKASLTPREMRDQNTKFAKIVGGRGIKRNKPQYFGGRKKEDKYDDDDDESEASTLSL